MTDVKPQPITTHSVAFSNTHYPYKASEGEGRRGRGLGGLTQHCLRMLCPLFVCISKSAITYTDFLISL